MTFQFVISCQLCVHSLLTIDYSPLATHH